MILGKLENKENFVLDAQSDGKVTKFLCKKVNRPLILINEGIDERGNDKEEKTHVSEGIKIFPQQPTEIMKANTNKRIACNCKNSQCLKLYCECFSSLLYCDPNICSCKGCSNDTQNETLRSEKIKNYLRKNPSSFRNILVSKTSNSLLEKKGCTCKKSGCMKKYCECFQNNAKCGDHCKCLDCKNTVENVNSSSKSSTRTSSFSNYSEYKKGKRLVPCMVIINNYKINEEFSNKETMTNESIEEFV